MDESGNLYGTTFNGGLYYSGIGTGGAAFKLTPPSAGEGSWTESILRSFGKGHDGALPECGLIIDNSGNLYGTTFIGGVHSAGTVFSLTPPHTTRGKWSETMVWSFGGMSDGNGPGAGLIADPRGNYYGTTSRGGDPDVGAGTVFEISSVLTASPTKLNFGNVAAPGTSKPKKVKLTNKGTIPAHISTVTATAPFTIAGGANTCSGQIIAPKKTCTFAVEFAPTAVESASGSIDVTYNGTSPAVALTGNGIAPK